MSKMNWNRCRQEVKDRKEAHKYYSTRSRRKSKPQPVKLFNYCCKVCGKFSRCRTLKTFHLKLCQKHYVARALASPPTRNEQAYILPTSSSMSGATSLERTHSRVIQSENQPSVKTGIGQDKRDYTQPGNQPSGGSMLRARVSELPGKRH